VSARSCGIRYKGNEKEKERSLLCQKGRKMRRTIFCWSLRITCKVTQASRTDPKGEREERKRGALPSCECFGGKKKGEGAGAVKSGGRGAGMGKLKTSPARRGRKGEKNPLSKIENPAKEKAGNWRSRKKKKRGKKGDNVFNKSLRERERGEKFLGGGGGGSWGTPISIRDGEGKGRRPLGKRKADWFLYPSSEKNSGELGFPAKRKGKGGKGVVKSLYLSKGGGKKGGKPSPAPFTLREKLRKSSLREKRKRKKGRERKCLNMPREKKKGRGTKRSQSR